VRTLIFSINLTVDGFCNHTKRIADDEGYDIKSISPEELNRYLEVKGGCAGNGSAMLSENEMNRLAQLGDSAWLFIDLNCKSISEANRIQNPFKALNFELKTNGIVYFLPKAEWKNIFVPK